MSTDEKVVEKTCVLALMAVLAWGLCEPQMVIAQVSAQGGEAHGMFGSRTLGQSFTPRPSTFGGGIQTGPSGSFLYLGRANGSIPFAATPWQRIDPGVLSQAVTVAPALPAAKLAVPGARVLQPPAPPTNVPEVPIVPPPSLSYVETHGWQGPPVESAAGAPSLPYTRSPALSNRLTAIARSKGMLVGEGIDVYVANHYALVQGNVRTLADRSLLANVLALEPDVMRIDNRLLATESGPLSASRSVRR